MGEPPNSGHEMMGIEGREWTSITPMNVQVGDPRDLALCFGVFADVRAVQVWSVEEAIVGALWSVRRFASWRRGLAGLRSMSGSLDFVDEVRYVREWVIFFESFVVSVPFPDEEDRTECSSGDGDLTVLQRSIFVAIVHSVMMGYLMVP
ncbi:hypothetical protein G5I_13873 [Acromyrmex echinatior]|uniref:Uncharacterized protein n=1 Tax=Acromyrmex echinatior TaxID=103372 RepID=F4X668_ACREC|nr:hypothetical protein G5I_13873 [Acromyrmex echinatior]